MDRPSDPVLERILSLIPVKENGEYVRGAKKTFCESIGITQQNLSDWIAGRSTRYMDKLYEISNVYGVDVNWLKYGQSTEDMLDEDRDQMNRERRLLMELQSLKDDEDFLVLMDAYKKMTPEKVQIMKRFVKAMTEEENYAN